jgi:hypothetical protein
VTRGLYLRKFAFVPSACAVLVFATLASAQHVDVAVGASTLFSTKNPTASLGYLPPAEKGGIYPSFSITRIFENRFGYNAEVSFRDKQGIYNNFQKFRPIFYDVNAVFAPRLAKKISADLVGGIGGESVLFYTPYGNCNFPSGCNTHLNSNHLLFHLSADIRYMLWKRMFVRPEAHLYRIVNNTADFHSDNVLRLGASIGYTFGSQ